MWLLHAMLDEPLALQCLLGVDDASSICLLFRQRTQASAWSCSASHLKGTCSWSQATMPPNDPAQFELAQRL